MRKNKYYKTKALFLFLIFFGHSFFVTAQLTIENCQAKAKANYPLIKQYNLIEQSKTYNLANAVKSWIPQVSLSARATYQSDVTQIPVTMPGIDIPVISKDQYQIVAEVNQTIWDGGMISSQRKSIEAASLVDKQKVEVDLYALNERVNNLFFGILLIDRQLEQNKTFEKELQINYDKVASYMANGLANQADLDAVKVEQLNNEQRKSELQILRNSYTQMLSTMIGETVDDKTILTLPSSSEYVATDSIHRPELQLFTAQSNLLEVQRKGVLAKGMPKIGAFFQGGYGQPGLNMFKEGFVPYFMTGIRLSWNFGNLYTLSGEKKTIETNKQSVEVQKEAFLFNTNLQIEQQTAEIKKYKVSIQNDDEVIRLRHNIKMASEAKMENGTMSVSDYLRDVNNEEMAKQAKNLHEIQLLMSVYNLKLIINDK